MRCAVAGCLLPFVHTCACPAHWECMPAGAGTVSCLASQASTASYFASLHPCRLAWPSVCPATYSSLAPSPLRCPHFLHSPHFAALAALALCSLASFAGGVVIPKETVLTVPCDVLIPAAIGGVIDEDNAGDLQCKVGMLKKPACSAL